MSSQLCVVILPSANQMGWFEAISSAADAGGWTVSPSEIGTKPFLVVCTNAESVVGWAGQDVVVIGSSTKAAIKATVDANQTDYLTGVRNVATQYAYAERLQSDGAVWLSADADVLDFPFGSVRNPGPNNLSPDAGGREVLSHLDGVHAGSSLQGVWPPHLFLHERPGLPDKDGEIFDLTGRRRVIRYGPYIEMPTGVWQAKVPFTLWIDNAIVEIRVEWGSGLDVTSVTEVIRNSGRYEVTLVREWLQVETCEIRIWLDRGVFDGTIQLHDPSIIRL